MLDYFLHRLLKKEKENCLVAGCDDGSVVSIMSCFFIYYNVFCEIKKGE